MVTKFLPFDYFLFLACFAMIGACYYYCVVIPRKELEEASLAKPEEFFMPTEETEDLQPEEVLDVAEFEKKYRIVKSKNELFSNYLENKIGYECIHEELQRINLVTGERNIETTKFEPLKRPRPFTHTLSGLFADTYEESILSSGLVCNWFQNPIYIYHIKNPERSVAPFIYVPVLSIFPGKRPR